MSNIDYNELFSDVNEFTQAADDFSSNYLDLLSHAAANTPQGVGLTDQQLTALLNQAGAAEYREMALRFEAKWKNTSDPSLSAAWKDAVNKADALADGKIDPRYGGWSTFSSNTRWALNGVGKIATHVSTGLDFVDGTSAALAGDWRRVAEVTGKIAAGAAVNGLLAYALSGFIVATGPVGIIGAVAVSMIASNFASDYGGEIFWLCI